MTIDQKQCLLRYLGYYSGDIDGIWGQKSQAAAMVFRQSYMDGTDDMEKRLLEVVASGEKPKAAEWWREIRYFRREEFRCPCGRCGGFPAEPDETLVRLADQAREHFGAPATVSSGVRCQNHNDELPGSAKNSYHIKGKAMDFCVRGVPGAKLLAYVKTLPVHYAYQINGSDFVHIDVA